MTHVAPSVQRKPALIFSLMAQEPLKLKRKFNVFLPLALNCVLSRGECATSTGR